MKKKIYVAPAIEVANVELGSLIMASPDKYTTSHFIYYDDQLTKEDILDGPKWGTLGSGDDPNTIPINSKGNGSWTIWDD